MTPHRSLEDVLIPAYEPCHEFNQNCQEMMRWDPKAGHIPRGFAGACGDLSEVELVLVFAEPGNPHIGERHCGLLSAYYYAMLVLATGKDQFHRNVRKILDSSWPGMSFQEQMRKVWLTNSVLCSAPVEGGHVPRNVALACGHRYLLAQLNLLPNALVVALGQKAQDRLRTLGVTGHLSVFAAAPPGCNKPGAVESWDKIPIELRQRRHNQA